MTDDSTTDRAYLIYEFERRAYPLGGAFTIGRDAGSTIVVREPSVSRLHAEVRPEADAFVLHASGAIGTKVNGEPVGAPVQLKEGDRIEVGSAELTFRYGKLPLGVSVVDPADTSGHDPDIMTKRDTIKSPILGAANVPQKKGSMAAMLILMVVLLIVAGYYFLFRR